MPGIKPLTRITGGILLLVASAMGLAALLPPRESVYDFIMLYTANLGILQRVPIYDYAAIMALTAAKISPASASTLLPYPYPPWVALSTFYLGFLPLQRAASAWMLLNIAMLAASILLLTAGLKPFARSLAALAGLMFIPSLGLIVVGQYSAPVLLGACLFMVAARREDAPLSALSLLLMTFKPHLGLFLFPAGFFWLVVQKTPFARRAVWLTVSGGLLLGMLGFLADPAWPLTYTRALMAYSSLPGVASRDLSASFPVLLLKLVLGEPGTVWAAWLSLAVFVLTLMLFWRFRVFAAVETLITGSILLTLLSDPYLFNYDYVLLLLPLIYLATQARNLAMRVTLAAIYVLPWLSLLLARGANIFYALSAMVLVAVLFYSTKHSRQHIDLQGKIYYT